MLRRAACLQVLAAIVLGVVSLEAAEGETTPLWTYPVPEQGALQMDLPSTWTEVARDRKSGAVRFRTRDAPRADLTIVVSWSEVPDPAFNGAPRLHSLIEEAGREFLDQAVEARVTIRELRGPQAGGYYWTLRDRMPKSRGRATYVTRGMVGAGKALLDFTLITPQSDMPEIRQALKMIASARPMKPDAEGPP